MIVYGTVKTRVSRGGKIHERSVDLILGGLYCVAPLRIEALHIGRSCRLLYTDRQHEGVPVVWQDTGEEGTVDATDLALVTKPTEAETEAELAKLGPVVRAQLPRCAARATAGT